MMLSQHLPSRLMLWLCIVLLVCVPQGHSEELDCLIEPFVTVKLTSAVNGLLETVTVDRGDVVKKGQVLATLESGAEKAAIDMLRAKATMESAVKTGEARVELSTRSQARNEGMFHKALIPADKMDEIETTKRLAEMALLEATDNRRIAEFELRRATAELVRRTLYSPITGVVVERLLAPGEFARDEQPVLTLAQLDPLRVEVFAPVALLGSISVGQRVEVMPQAPVNGTYSARVTVVDRMVDAASGMFGVRLELPNRDYRLPAGLKCKIRFP
jgi:RND family efflux transporter MFP subunit